MKLLKELFIILLCLTLSISLFACDGGKDPCTEHVDENEDLVCDVCGEEVEKKEDEPPVEDELKLIDGGEAKFQIVVGTKLDAAVLKAIDTFIDNMDKLGITVKRVEDENSGVQSCEVLVGDVKSRGDKYDYDQYSLGKKGYVITRVDNKLIVEGGSAETALEAFEAFVEDIIGYEKGVTAEELASVVYTEKDEVVEIQDNYRITAVTAGGEDMKGYTIAVDKTKENHLEAALSLQDTLYSKAGYYLEIVSLDEAGEKSIVIESVPILDSEGNVGEAGDKGFRVYLDGKTVRIVCAYENKFDDAFSNLVAKMSVVQGKLEFVSTRDYFTQEISRLYYKDFSDIKGDGITNDFAAIKAVHDMANECGQTVVAQNGKTYYIKETGGKPIIIKTNVEFGTAKFIVDDVWIDYTSEYATERNTNIFEVYSDYEIEGYSETRDPLGIIARINENGGIKTTDTVLDLGLGYKAMLILCNKDVHMYNRWGQHAGTKGPDNNGDGIVDEGHANAGQLVGGNYQREVIVIDKDGNIDPSAPLLFDYEKVTSIDVIRVDDTPITISGGIFTTLANKANDNNNYFYRGFEIQRANVTVTGMKHYVTEGDKTAACPYAGWIYARYCNNLTVKDTVLTGRQYFNQGNYDIGGAYSNDLKFINVTQTNFYKDEAANTVYTESEYWGIMGTNYCKNIVYDSCILSRLDAHAGVVNVTIKNTKIRQIYLIGGGNATIEGCTIYNNYALHLRVDYGSTWRGDITVKDCTIVPQSLPGNSGVVKGTWTNWAFGYNAYMPQNVVVDNVTVSAEPLNFYVLDYVVSKTNTEAMTPDASNNPVPNRNQIVITKTVTIKNQTMEFDAITPNTWCSGQITVTYEE